VSLAVLNSLDDMIRHHKGRSFGNRCAAEAYREAKVVVYECPIEIREAAQLLMETANGYRRLRANAKDAEWELLDYYAIRAQAFERASVLCVDEWTNSGGFF